MILILMGVSGSGKTEVGRRLAAELGWPFYEGDAFHPPENIAKMSRGLPLSDADRQPWLEALQALIAARLAREDDGVVACSALKSEYREKLRQSAPGVRFVYLKGDIELIRKRLEARQGHFMKAGLLESQFAALEEPEEALAVEVDQAPEKIVQLIRSHYALHSRLDP